MTEFVPAKPAEYPGETPQILNDSACSIREIFHCVTRVPSLENSYLLGNVIVVDQYPRVFSRQRGALIN